MIPTLLQRLPNSTLSSHCRNSRRPGLRRRRRSILPRRRCLLLVRQWAGRRDLGELYPRHSARITLASPTTVAPIFQLNFHNVRLKLTRARRVPRERISSDSLAAKWCSRESSACATQPAWTTPLASAPAQVGRWFSGGQARRLDLTIAGGRLVRSIAMGMSRWGVADSMAIFESKPSGIAALRYSYLGFSLQSR